MTNQRISLILVWCILFLPIPKIDYGTVNLEYHYIDTISESTKGVELKEKPSEKKIEFELTKIILTNYYVEDSTGSTTKTSSGLTIKDFEVNNLGWYTYKKMVVMGSATNICLRAKSGACGKYNVLPKGYLVYDLFDRIEFFYKDKRYIGIILDSCGACMRINGEEKYQRFDIFIQSKKYAFGKVNSEIIKEIKN